MKKDVKTADGSATIDASAVSGLKVGSGYRINLVADSSNVSRRGFLDSSSLIAILTIIQLFAERWNLGSVPAVQCDWLFVRLRLELEHEHDHQWHREHLSGYPNQLDRDIIWTSQYF